MVDDVIKAFLLGNDWWRDVVTFYIGMSNRPDQLVSTVEALFNAVITSSRAKDPKDITARGRQLLSAIRETFPSLGGLARDLS